KLYAGRFDKGARRNRAEPADDAIGPDFERSRFGFEDHQQPLLVSGADLLRLRLVENLQAVVGIAARREYGREVAILRTRELAAPDDDVHVVLSSERDGVLDRRITGTD